jgi:RNA polymerase sigma-70 factor (ECF subfamily)
MNATCTRNPSKTAAAAPAPAGFPVGFPVGFAGGFAGDFDELYAEFQPRVLAYCRAVLHHDEDALDAAQETMLAVFRHHSELRQVRSVWNFLRCVAANKCHDVLRRRQLHARWLDSLRTDDAEPIVLEQDSCDLLPDDEARLRAGLMQSIARLSVRLRRAVELRYVRGFDCRQIAFALGISQGTVKSRLSRARARLARSPGVAALRAHGVPGRRAS